MTITYVVGTGLYVNVTNRCPCDCEFCIRYTKDTVGDSSTLWLEWEPTREEILSDILSRNLAAYSELVFCGFGEPLSRFDDVAWVCAEVRKVSDIRIRINTNGLADLITKRKCAADLSGLVDAVSVSLNASAPEGYLKRCRPVFGINAFKAILDFTADCKKYIPEVVMTVVDTMDEEELLACKSLCEATGAVFRVRKHIN